jgi:hypothetical protein
MRDKPNIGDRAMAKSTSAIVSNLGIIMSIFTNLINRVVVLGGSEEMVRQLANPDNPLIQRIAKMLVNQQKTYRPDWPKICEVLRTHHKDSVPYNMAKLIISACLSDPVGMYDEKIKFYTPMFCEVCPFFWSEDCKNGPVPISTLNKLDYGFIICFWPDHAQHLAITNECAEHLEIPVFNGDASKYPIYTSLRYRDVDYVVVKNRNNSLDEKIRDILLIPKEMVAMDL